MAQKSGLGSLANRFWEWEAPGFILSKGFQYSKLTRYPLKLLAVTVKGWLVSSFYPFLSPVWICSVSKKLAMYDSPDVTFSHCSDSNSSLCHRSNIQQGVESDDICSNSHWFHLFHHLHCHPPLISTYQTTQGAVHGKAIWRHVSPQHPQPEAPRSRSTAVTPRWGRRCKTWDLPAAVDPGPPPSVPVPVATPLPDHRRSGHCCTAPHLEGRKDPGAKRALELQKSWTIRK